MSLQKTFFVWLSLVSTAVSVAAVDIRAGSTFGRTLLENARSLQNNDNVDYSFIAEYAIKFQGCHHVQQWNDNADEENDVKIMTKRLVRFRLCPVDQCSNDKSAGCTSKFGDYIVDLDTFVDAYLGAVEQDSDELCGDAYDECYEKCGQDGDCMQTCYESLDLSLCYVTQQLENFNVREYAACQQFQMGRRRKLQNYNEEYFIGAFCADQGGEIHLGMFTDDTCTAFASNGYSIFQSTMGYTLPFSETSLVTSRCMACGVSNDGQYQSKGFCENTYALSGKCETRMTIDYPNESSCNYIEGIKIIREDGVIRTSAVKKSKAAAVSIGLFTTLSVLLGAYVYYLRTKLARAQINLSAAAHPLT
jgi:hypothetical protein